MCHVRSPADSALVAKEPLRRNLKPETRDPKPKAQPPNQNQVCERPTGSVAHSPEAEALHPHAYTMYPEPYTLNPGRSAKDQTVESRAVLWGEDLQKLVTCSLSWLLGGYPPADFCIRRTEPLRRSPTPQSLNANLQTKTRSAKNQPVVSLTALEPKPHTIMLTLCTLNPSRLILAGLRKTSR